MKKKVFKISFFIVVVFIVGLVVYNNSQFVKNKKEQSNLEKVVIKYEKISKEGDNSNVVLEYQKEFDNTDILGELSISNTNLVVPVAQASDNDYYLNHLLDKSYNTLGSVFLDYRNKVDDRKILIYGHNSKLADTEFKLLENYADKNYYTEHSDIYFKTIGSNYHYKIFSVYIATTDYRHVNLRFDDNGYIEHLRWLKSQSLYETSVDVYNEDILVLQTCYYNPEGSFLIVAAKKVA